MPGCHNEFASYAHGTKGSAVISTSAHTPGKVPHLQGPQHAARSDLVWAFPQPEPSPYQLEWDDLIDAIRQDKPYNEVKRGAEASLVTSMGRMAAHTGQIVTYDEILNCDHEFAPDVDKLTMDAPAPLQPAPTASTRCRSRGQEAGVLKESAKLLSPRLPMEGEGVGSRFRGTTLHVVSSVHENDSRPLPARHLVPALHWQSRGFQGLKSWGNRCRGVSFQLAWWR